MAGTTTYYGVTYPTSTDYVKDGASAIQTVATGFDSAVAIPTYNAQTGTTYTFALTDVGKTVTASNASAQTYTIPPTASVAWPTGTTLSVTNLGAGVVTFAAGAGVTVTNTTQTITQYQSARLIRTALNAWTVVPNSGSIPGTTLINTTTFSAVSSQSLNNVFSATYDNYLLIMEYLTTGSGIALRARFRVGGSDNSVSSYNSQLIIAGGTSVSAVREQNQTSAFFTNTNANRSYTAATIFSPFATKVTFGTNTYSYGGSATTMEYMGNNFGFPTTDSFDGITIFPASGTMTGVISIYGISK